MLKASSKLVSASQLITPISLAGNVTLSTGNLVIGTSGKGIDFSVTSSGSGTMTSELLADYEEGTWTPNQGSGLTVVGAFSSVGRYTKIGNMVTVWGQVTGATSIAVSAIGFITTNLPFAEQTDIGAMGIAAGFWTSMNSAIHISVGATTSVYSVQAVSGSTSIAFTISYRV
jgi:hypothetical protein